MAAKRKFAVFFLKVSELHVNNLGALLGQSEVVPKPILMSLVKTLAKTKEPSSLFVVASWSLFKWILEEPTVGFTLSKQSDYLH